MVPDGPSIEGSTSSTVWNPLQLSWIASWEQVQVLVIVTLHSGLFSTAQDEVSESCNRRIHLEYNGENIKWLQYVICTITHNNNFMYKSEDIVTNTYIYIFKGTWSISPPRMRLQNKAKQRNFTRSAMHNQYATQNGQARSTIFSWSCSLF